MKKKVSLVLAFVLTSVIFGILFIIHKVSIDTPYNFGQDRLECYVYRGTWKRLGLAQEYGCVKKYTDGDKVCSSSSECQGDCIVSDPDKPPVCQSTDSPYGCFTSIENFNRNNSIICSD